MLLETLATTVPALQLGIPLSTASQCLAEGHTVLQTFGEERRAALLVMLASSGKGKTRFLFELNGRLQEEKQSLCIPITFNGQQSLEQDSQVVKGLTTAPRERAVVHVALRLLQSTFKIENLAAFAAEFCANLKAAKVPLTPLLLRQVLATCQGARVFRDAFAGRPG